MISFYTYSPYKCLYDCFCHHRQNAVDSAYHVFEPGTFFNPILLFDLWSLEGWNAIVQLRMLSLIYLRVSQADYHN